MMRRLGPADYRDMPWKNGGGVTRELLKLPHPSDPARFLARLSIATVGDSGPFSVFPGVDRTLMILDGAGVALTLRGEREVVLDRRWQPFAFPGEAEIQCRLLGGPVRDFNLMVDRALAQGALAVVLLAPGETRTLAGA
ncbi:MAG TPA: HutD family protein, partial [Archangium sp.]|nr:HutD family protein [Archangium sp.]